MPTPKPRDKLPEADEQHDKVRTTNPHLARHERLSRITLILLFIVDAVLLVLALKHLWQHPWIAEGLRSLIAE